MLLLSYAVQIAKELFEDILNAISMSYKLKKTISPTTHLLFLGICLDTTEMSASIKQEKKRHIVELLMPWITRSFTRLKKLQSIISKLMWVAQIVPQEKIFIQALIE